ncbi:MAG: GNAT family N-acetyltransferase [Lentisphaerae bacterium]|nr:GNAT family N-acetyltransferase [Lentisphaerota bacterium]
MAHSPSIAHRVEQGLAIRVHGTAAETEELRAFWSRVQKHPNSDLDHFLLVCRLRPEVVGVCVLSVWDHGDCVCVVAGRISHLEIQPRIGYFKAPCVRARMLSIVHEGVLGEMDGPRAVLVVGRIREFLSDGTIDIASFNGLKEDAPLLVALGASSGETLGVSKPQWNDHWELTLPSQAGFLLQAMKSKHRTWFRKKSTELEKASNGQVVWQWHSRVDDFGHLGEQMEAVAARTYQRALGVGFRNDEEHRERLSLFASKDMFRAMLMEFQGKPAAFWYGIVYGGTFHSEATGFVRELQEFEVGTQMFVRVVDELVKEGVGRFDFGLGDAHYKKRFGDRAWREVNVRLFGATRRGNMLRVYIGGCEAVDRLLRALIQRFGLVDKLKQAWRRRLAKRTNQSTANPGSSGADARES